MQANILNVFILFKHGVNYVNIRKILCVKYCEYIHSIHVCSKVNECIDFIHKRSGSVSAYECFD